MAPPRDERCSACGRPRAPRQTMRLCADCARTYNNAHNRLHRATHADAATQYRRLRAYRAAALALGATEAEAAWISMAADLAFERGQSRPHWLADFARCELDYLRANAGLRASLDIRTRRAS